MYGPHEASFAGLVVTVKANLELKTGPRIGR
jgi:hypothetical protein